MIGNSISFLDHSRLITTGLAVLQKAENGQLFDASETSQASCIEAFQDLQAAIDIAVKSLPNNASPFMRYRIEVLDDIIAAQMLRGLVLHMAGDDQFIHLNLSVVLSSLDAKYTGIALEMLMEFAKDPYDDNLQKLAESIRTSPAKLPESH